MVERNNPDASAPDHHTAEPIATTANTPAMGGGLPLVQYWAEKTLSPQGPQIWQTLMHKSACLSCAWGTGGQKGGFVNELEEPLQRCMKSVEAIASELQPGVGSHCFDDYSLEALQQLTSLECDRLGRLSFPVIHRAGSTHYERIDWQEVYQIAETAFQQPAGGTHEVRLPCLPAVIPGAGFRNFLSVFAAGSRQ
jgi:anaerobic selenocysteine-containing dehydrogenase